MFEVTAVGGDSQRAMNIERVAPGVRVDLDRAGDSLQTLIREIRTLTAEPMNAYNRRGITNSPYITPRPKSRNAQVRALRISENDVDRDLIKRIGISGAGNEGCFNRDIGLGRQRLIFGSCDRIAPRHSDKIRASLKQILAFIV